MVKKAKREGPDFDKYNQNFEEHTEKISIKNCVEFYTNKIQKNGAFFKT